MFSKSILSAVLIALVATASSAALAASKTARHDGRTAFAAATAPRPISGAEWFQNNGISESIGSTYRR